MTLTLHDTAELAAELPSVPGLDIAAGLRRVQGRRDRYVELLRLFVADQKGTVDTLRSALAEGDWLLATRTAHNCKSVAATVGARSVADLAAGLEATTRCGHRADEAVQALDQALSTQLAAIHDWLGARRQPSPPAGAEAAAPAGPRARSVLIVDDAAVNLQLLADVLRPRYAIRVARDGERALEIAQGPATPDLILLDVEMPGLDGYEICRRLKQHESTREVPVIFLTARLDAADEERGFEAGAADYICKPVIPPLLLARVEAHLASKALRDVLADRAACLEAEVERRTSEIASIQDVTIHVMATLAETRDNETGNHVCRTQWYVKLLAEQLSRHPRFAGRLTPRFIDLLFKSAPLHDLGKIGIPDAILLKPGRLEPWEFEVMKSHPALARDAIEQAEARLGRTVPFLRVAKEIAYGHHEKWDGTGYPQGLAGDAIPLPARLMAVADVYDALISKRVYKPAMSHAEAVRLIEEGRGRHFDPDVVDAFLAIQPDFVGVSRRFTD
jgi:putative two-component system response regulator